VRLWPPTARVLTQDLSSTSAYNAGVWGTSSAGTGVLGTSTTGNGVVGKIDKANGSNAAVLGEDSSSGFISYTAGVMGTTGGGSGVYGSASGADGIGVKAYASLGTALSAETDGNAYPALVIFSTGGDDIADGVGSNDSQWSFDTNANLHTTGDIFTSGPCSSGCVRRRRVQSYATTATLPTIEDDGESAVVRGAVAVRLDPAFANAIDFAQSYLVQVTPEGDTRGLSVASRSATGFVVCEIINGRGTVPFEYHIVAHPYGIRARRLPFVDVPTHR
jgi:hypothetical protein